MKYLTPAVFLLSFIFVSCEKEMVSNNAQTEIVLDSIFPRSARVGDTVILYGKNFPFNYSELAITIGGDSTEFAGITDGEIKFVVRKKFSDTVVNLHFNNEVMEGFPIKYRYIAVVTTIAGTGDEGNNDGAARYASFKCPWGLALDNQNNLLVADSYNRLIRKIDLAHPDLAVSSISPGTLEFFSPYNIATDTSNGSIFVTDFNAHILKIDGAGNPSVLYTSPILQTSTGIAVGPDKMVYVSDNVNHKIFKIDQDGNNRDEVAEVFLPRNLVFDAQGMLYTSTSRVVQVSSNGTLRYFDQSEQFQGWEITLDKNGNFFQADHFHNRIQKVNRKTGEVTVIAGSGAAADIDGTGTAAAFNGPMSIVADIAGNLYVSTYNFDTGGGNRIRKITFE